MHKRVKNSCIHHTYHIQKIKYIILILVFAIFCSITSPVWAQEKNSTGIVLVINPIRGPQLGLEDRDLTTSLAGQIEATQQANVPATWLWTYSALSDEKLTNLATAKTINDEHGLFLEIDPFTAERAGVSYRGKSQWYHSDGLLLVSYTPHERQKIIDTFFNKFKQTFGHYPTSVGAWWIGAQSINYMQQTYGITAVMQCADQFATDAYSIWGTPWSITYQPSRRNAAIPAQNDQDQSYVAMIQWAPRDPLMAYGPTTENSTYSAQDYTYKNYSNDYFVDLQNTFAKTSNDTFAFGLESGFAPDVYQLAITQKVQSLQDQTIKPTFTTMQQYAAQFLASHHTLQPTASGLYTQYQGTDRAWWYHSPQLRILIHQKGNNISLVDLRDYTQASDEEFNLVPNTQHLLRINTTAVIDTIRFPSHQWLLTQSDNHIQEIKTANQTTLQLNNQPLITIQNQTLTIHTTQPPPENIRSHFQPKANNEYQLTNHSTTTNWQSKLHSMLAVDNFSHHLSQLQHWTIYRKRNIVITALAVIFTIVFTTHMYKNNYCKTILTLILGSIILTAIYFYTRPDQIIITPSEQQVLSFLRDNQIPAALVITLPQNPSYTDKRPLFTANYNLIDQLTGTKLQQLPTELHKQIDFQYASTVIIPRYLGYDISDTIMQEKGYTKKLDEGTIAVYQRL